MTDYSYATDRKIRKIKEHFGPTWTKELEGRSIDAVYNEVVGDTRKNLFCKIDSRVKTRLDEMVSHHGVKMAELVEQMIEAEYSRFGDRQISGEQRMLAEFSGTTG